MPIKLSKLPLGLLLFAIAVLVYMNTAGHDFALDDSIVITENMYTQDGLSGWKGLLTKDTFYGFFKEEGKGQLVAGGRYRPLSPMLFAAVHQVVGNKPLVYHVMNILLYGLCSLLVFRFFRTLLIQKPWPHADIVAFAGALLFTLHPVHTEVVANIKGADEILATIGALICLITVIKYQTTAKVKYLIIAGLAFFLSLLSKENTVTLLVIVPMTLWITSKKNSRNLIKPTLLLAAVFIIYFVIRMNILDGSIFSDAPKELMNNPFLKYEGNALVAMPFAEKFGTILYSLLLYIKLLIFPHPLVHDYYPRHIPITTLTNAWSILSLMLHTAMTIWAIMHIRKKNLAAYCILFYIAAMSITSNILFPVGTTMSERFLFFPSIGFCLLVGVGINYLIQKNKTIGWGLLILISIGFAFKTITRNAAWKDNFKLFQTDVKYAPNSAKLQNAAAGSLITKYESLEKGVAKTAYMKQAAEHAAEAIKIHPRYKNAYLLKGNAHLYQDEYEQAIQSYNAALRLDPGYDEAQNNMHIALRSAGRYYGETKNDLTRSLEYLKQAHASNSKDPETLRLLGIAYGIKGTHTKAIEYFSKLLDEKPNDPAYWRLLGTAFHNNGQTTERDQVLKKAEELENQKK